MDIKIKRVYDPPDSTDGKRVLVDRLWPRGVTKEQAALSEWMREVAPSPELRRWFGHKPERFNEFKVLYAKELSKDPVHRVAIHRLIEYATEGPLTLIYAAKDPSCNHALVLQKELLGH